MSEQIKVLLDESEMPRQWYNIQADLPHPMPPPVGKDGKPIGPDALAPVFPMNLIEQEVSTQRWIDIPDPCCRSSGSGGRRRCSAPAAWRRRSAHRPTFTTRTKASRLPAATSRTPPSRRRITTRPSESSGSLRKPARASGAARSPWAASCSAWRARSTWSASASTRSRSGR